MRAKRRDANEVEIVRALRKMGMTVLLSDAVDLIIGYHGVNYLIEIKDKTTLKKDGKFKYGSLRPSQKKLLAEWRGQYHVVSSLDQILEIIKCAI